MKSVACAVCLCVFGSSGVALADPHPAAARAGSYPVDNYQYVFTDDPVNAGLFGANEPRIVVRPGAGRGTLIRPRVSFVMEMLKSVETL
jgi:hypothetical protein